MKIIRALIVDDEPLARKTLRLLLTKDREIRIVGECKNGKEAATKIAELTPDLVFLDVQMPNMGGFEVIDAVGADRMPAVVFVTAYDSYALRAFDAQALDYLLKPFDDPRFEQALRRAKRAIRGTGLQSFSKQLTALTESHIASKKPLRRILVRSGAKVFLLSTDDIVWIRAADYCVEIHTARGRHIHRESLTSLTQKLDPSRFFRTHRSAIVNMEHIEELLPAPHGDYVVQLKNGTSVKLSRTRKRDLESRLS